MMTNHAMTAMPAKALDDEPRVNSLKETTLKGSNAFQGESRAG
jgi:hypothetical protein